MHVRMRGMAASRKHPDDLRDSVDRPRHALHLDRRNIKARLPRLAKRTSWGTGNRAGRRSFSGSLSSSR